MQEAKDKGIKTTFIDSYTESNIQDMTVATDNLEAGKQLGEYARTFLNKDSQIAIVSHVKGVFTAIEREQGFREGLGDYNKNVVDVVYCNSQFDKHRSPDIPEASPASCFLFHLFTSFPFAADPLFIVPSPKTPLFGTMLIVLLFYSICN